MSHGKRRTSRRTRKMRLACKNGKARYRSKEEALEHLHKIIATSEKPQVPVRAYRCEHCLGWHLTSQEYKTKETEEDDE